MAPSQRGSLSRCVSLPFNAFSYLWECSRCSSVFPFTFLTNLSWQEESLTLCPAPGLALNLAFPRGGVRQTGT
eukprot:1162038-Pelagomonas_calceolata.AAC.3